MEYKLLNSYQFPSTLYTHTLVLHQKQQMFCFFPYKFKLLLPLVKCTQSPSGPHTVTLVLTDRCGEQCYISRDPNML